jgi:hypothetical protein
MQAPSLVDPVAPPLNLSNGYAEGSDPSAPTPVTAKKWSALALSDT